MVGVPVICVNVAVGPLAVAVVVAVGYLDDESVSRWWRRWVLDSSITDDGDEGMTRSSFWTRACRSL